MAVYLVTINTTAPVDLDLVMREATTWLGERLDSTGEHPINITVYDLTSRVVTEHDYEPEPETTVSPKLVPRPRTSTLPHPTERETP